MEQAETTGTRILEEAARRTERLTELFSGLLALPIKGLTWVIIRVRTGDPKVNEKAKCPACGHRVAGRLNFIRTQGAEQAAVQHTCGMCGAEFYSPLVLKADKWLGKYQSPETKAAQKLEI